MITTHFTVDEYITYVRGLINRLRGVYTVPVNDGAGLLGGKDTFTQVFDTPLISKEAANALELLVDSLEDTLRAPSAQPVPAESSQTELQALPAGDPPQTPSGRNERGPSAQLPQAEPERTDR